MLAKRRPTNESSRSSFFLGRDSSRRYWSYRPTEIPTCAVGPHKAKALPTLLEADHLSRPVLQRKLVIPRLVADHEDHLRLKERAPKSLHHCIVFDNAEPSHMAAIRRRGAAEQRPCPELPAIIAVPSTRSTATATGAQSDISCKIQGGGPLVNFKPL